MIRVRPAHPEDVGLIAEIHIRTWQSAYRGLLPDDFLDQLTATEREPLWADVIAHPPAGSWLAVALHTIGETERLIGFCSAGAARGTDDPEMGEIYAIYIDPAHQRAGAGTALLTAAERALRRATFRTAILWVLETNLPARAFYEGAGWNPDAQTKRDTIGGRPVVETRYWKRLTA